MGFKNELSYINEVGYPRGMDRTAYLEYLRGLYREPELERSAPSKQYLSVLDQFGIPALTAEEERRAAEERNTRSAHSTAMRNHLARILVNRAEYPRYLVEGQAIDKQPDRPLNDNEFSEVLPAWQLALLDDLSEDPPFREWNALLESDYASAKRQYLGQIAGAQETLRRSAGLDDAQFIREYPNIRRACRIIDGIEDFLADTEMDYAVTAAQRRALKKAQDESLAASQMLDARALLLSNPYYARLKPEWFQSMDLPAFRHDLDAELLTKPFTPDSPFDEFLEACAQYQLAQVPQHNAALANQLKALSEHPEQISLYCLEDGTYAGSGTQPNTEALASGRRLAALLPSGKVALFKPDWRDPQGFTLANPDANLRDLTHNNLSDLLAEAAHGLDAEDPALIKSSPQFKAMKATLAQVRKTYGALREADPQRDAETQRSLEQLKQATDNYLAIKSDRPPYNSDLERRRVAAATKLQRMVASKLGALKVTKQYTNEIGFYIAGRNIQDWGDRAFAYNSPAHKLSRDLAQALQEAPRKLNIYDSQGLTPANAQALNDLTARTLALYWISVERAQGDRVNPGPLETELNQTGIEPIVQSIKGSQSFQLEIQDKGPAELCRLCMTDQRYHQELSRVTLNDIRQAMSRGSQAQPEKKALRSFDARLL